MAVLSYELDKYATTAKNKSLRENGIAGYSGGSPETCAIKR
jgi:hypothetical protein